MPKKIMLLDGNSLINRAFYAMPGLTNKDGEPTSAIYGFINIFFKLYDEEKPDYIGVAFDLPKPTFRHLMYSEYKGMRKPMPDALRSQIPVLKNLLRLMGLKIYELEGYEADDVLGTLAKKAGEQGVNAVIVSGDRDMLQCATSTVKIRIPKTRAGKTEVEDYFEADVVEKMGVTPTEFISVKALMGDTSDNIPGVPGIGEKTAYKIICQYKTLENAIANVQDITPKKAQENLTAFKEQALLSLALATINVSAPVELDLNEAKTGHIYTQDALDEMTRLEFKSIIARFKERSGKKEAEQLSLFADEDETPDMSGAVIYGAADAADYLDAITGLAAYALIFDGERFLGVSVSSCTDSRFFPASDDSMVMACKGFFESETQKITLDAKQHITFLDKYGIKLKNVVFDAMIAAYILDASRDRYEYNDIALTFLNESCEGTEAVFGKGKSKLNPTENQIAAFALKQAEVLLKAYPVMKQQIKDNNQEYLFYEVEMPLIEVLADMELYGMTIDRQGLVEYGQRLDSKIENLRQSIYGLAGREFNINSPKQLGVVLFEELGLRGGKKTKTGWSTAAEVLEGLAGSHTIINEILEYRTYTKLKSTYVEGFLSLMDEKTGKIHSTFNQTVTHTGRISSTEPNLQNIPVRTELGRELRKVFIPSNSDYVFLDADYSQIELRILAHLSGDGTFIQAFKENQDIHRLTASQVLKIPLDEVTADQRRNAKAVNFGIVYGISAFSLSKDIGVSVKEAERYIEGYFEKYPRVKAYLEETVRKAKRDGFVSTIINRRRAVPELSAGNFVTRAFGERVAMNMPVQGTAADVIKIAMVKVRNWLKAEGMKSKLILQVHDELLLEAYKPELPALMTHLKEEMENAMRLSVPLLVDMHSGGSWFEAK